MNDRHVYPLEYSNTLTFSAFPDFLDWAADNWIRHPVVGEDEYLYWAGFYSNFLSTPYMASLGSILTLLADSFLEYDKARGFITDTEKEWWFGIWQGKILSALAQCDYMDMCKKAFQPPAQDIITVTKTFNV